MKKSILFVFALIPLLASCNQNSNGFPNPFPNDPYASQKIGFNLSDNEKIKRLLSTKETELLEKTISNLDYINKSLLRQETGEIHERDYTRAFAGVFGQGYTSSNMMRDETFKSFYQEADKLSNPTESLRERKETISNINSTYDYSYGQNTSKTDVRTIRYLATLGTGNKYYEFGDDIPSENGPAIAPSHTIEGKYEMDTSFDPDDDVDISASIIAAEGADLYKPLYTSQSEYVFKPTASDPVAGAYDDNHIIVIHEEHTPSDDYALPDGRTYKTAVNSLRVTSLVKTNDKVTSNDEPTPIGDYYLVERSRVYTEKAITSDVIQPNVPVTFLKNPIVINYKEEIHSFMTKTELKSVKKIEPVEIKL